MDCGTLNRLAIIDVITQWYYDTNREPYPAVMTPLTAGFSFVGGWRNDPHQWCWLMQ